MNFRRYKIPKSKFTDHVDADLKKTGKERWLLYDAHIQGRVEIRLPVVSKAIGRLDLFE